MHPHHYDKHATAHSGPSGSPTTTQAAGGDKNRKSQSVSTEDIRLCAYRKWESAGKPTGVGLQFWLEAEQELARTK